MNGTLSLAFILCFVAGSGFAQSSLNGRWRTDRPAAPPTLNDAQRQQSVQLEVTVEGDKASGTLQFGGIGGRFDTFKDGKVTGNKVQFRTDPRAVTWTIEMVADNTIMLYHNSDLPIDEGNVLDRISVLVEARQLTSPVQVATVVSPPPTPAATTAPGGANDSIRGIVHGPGKALIPGATVSATNVDTGVQLTTRTDEAGRYGFPGVMPGRYTMTASVSGFPTQRVSNLSLGDTQLLQDFTFEPPGYSAPANPTPATCGQNSFRSCTLLHRAK
jgi:hypothetical protein